MTIGKKTKKVLEEKFSKSHFEISISPGRMLQILREKNELTQAHLAARSGLTQATISSLENNRIRLGVERAKVLAKVLHVHPGVLLFPDWDESDLAA